MPPLEETVCCETESGDEGISVLAFRLREAW